MSWYWIGLALGIPPVAGLVVALPFWLTRQSMLGNIVGSGAILFGALLSIGREYLDMRVAREAAFAAGKRFQPSPDEFTRYAVFAGIGFAEVFALFMVGLLFEEWLRRRRHARAWR